jgi:GxxExxY protein
MRAPIPPDVERLGKAALDTAFRVHTELGPGLLESVYEACCAYELRGLGIGVETQVLLPVRYRDVQVDAGLRLDMVLENRVIVEFKAVEALLPLHSAQLLTYLKLTGIRLGYLLNFNVVRMKDGIKRLVL